jgi:hypothetical protein
MSGFSLNLGDPSSASGFAARCKDIFAAIADQPKPKLDPDQLNPDQLGPADSDGTTACETKPLR